MGVRIPSPIPFIINTCGCGGNSRRAGVELGESKTSRVGANPSTRTIYIMIQTKIRFIVLVDDYHEIEHIAEAIQGVELSTRELGMSGSHYVGLIFDGNCPGDGEVFDLVAALENIELSNLDITL